jgi:hypothetical protein
MAKPKDKYTTHYDSSFRPVWDEQSNSFVMVEGEPKLSKEDHKLYDQLVATMTKAKARAEEATAKARPGIEFICAVPQGSRIYCVNNRLFIAMPGRQPVELVYGQLQELRLASIAALQK